MAKKAKTKRENQEKKTRLLARAPADYVFWCHDGAIFADLSELARGLEQMSDETFAYHSNQEKHDFANWVRDIIGDGELADDLAKASSRLEALAIISKRLAWLTSI